MDDEDEVLSTLAEILGNFVKYVGGSKNIYCLIPPLEILCSVEEVSVREKVKTLIMCKGYKFIAKIM
jgi:serine/threonine-protein phosphatase 2A regulatory subunit A